MGLGRDKYFLERVHQECCVLVGMFSASLQALCWIFNTTLSKAIRTLTFCALKNQCSQATQSSTKMWLFGSKSLLFSKQFNKNCCCGTFSIHSYSACTGLLHGKELRIHRSAWLSVPLRWNPNQLSITGSIAVLVGHMLHPAVVGQSQRLSQGKAMFVPLPWSCITLTTELKNWLVLYPWSVLFKDALAL